jgi:hypothetical protein
MPNKLFLILFIIVAFIAAPSFAKNDKSKGRLPPGLQKKVDRGMSLPPGWQKKLAKGEILDDRVYKQAKIVVPIDTHGHITVHIEGKIVRLIAATREIIDILQ